MLLLEADFASIDNRIEFSLSTATISGNPVLAPPNLLAIHL